MISGSFFVRTNEKEAYGGNRDSAKMSILTDMDNSVFRRNLWNEEM